MAFLRTIGMRDAEGELRQIYDQMRARKMPAAYVPTHGDAPGIHRAHSLDPALMRVVFATSGTLHAGEALSWGDRELIAASASRANQCFY